VKWERCNERRNEKQLRLLSRDRTQRPCAPLMPTDEHAARLVYERKSGVAVGIKQVVKPSFARTARSRRKYKRSTKFEATRRRRLNYTTRVFLRQNSSKFPHLEFLISRYALGNQDSRRLDTIAGSFVTEQMCRRGTRFRDTRGEHRGLSLHRNGRREIAAMKRGEALSLSLSLCLSLSL